jgi:hypothetical protein
MCSQMKLSLKRGLTTMLEEFETMDDV